MILKCVLCGVEAGGELGQERAAFHVATNVPEGGSLPDDQPFLGVFGFWDQRQKKRIDLCGACLVSRLLYGPQYNRSATTSGTNDVPIEVLRKYSSPKPLKPLPSPKQHEQDP